MTFREGDQDYWNLQKQLVDLIMERGKKLATSPKNNSDELREKRYRVEEMKRQLDESVGNPDLHDEMTSLEAEIIKEEDTILEELDPGYVEKYRQRMNEINRKMVQN